MNFYSPSIFQPHVRAIVRGKAKARTEFGAKIGASIVEGYTFIDPTAGMPTTRARTSCYRFNFSKNASATFRPPYLQIRFTLTGLTEIDLRILKSIHIANL